MKKIILGIAFLSLALTGAAAAHHGSDDDDDGKDKPKPTTSAPEIDPASAMSALTLLAGGLAVIRSRRKSR